MSDFGALLIINSKTGQLNRGDLDDVENKIKQISNSEDLANSLGEPLLNKCDLVDEQGFCRLSEHYFGESGEEDIEFVKETETDEIDILIQKLSEEFDNLEFQAEITVW